MAIYNLKYLKESSKIKEDILTQKDGKPWLTDKNKTVPKICPKCGAKIEVFFRGEPVFLCTGKDKHYFGTVKCPEENK